MRAVGYIRTSTDRQELSPEAQRREIRSWASSVGLELVELVEDLGVPSWLPLDKRPGMIRALELVDDPEVVAFVAATTDRFARTPELLIEIRKRVEARGARTVGLDTPDLDSSPESKFIRHMLDGLPHYQLMKIRAATRKGLSTRRERGQLCGSAPIGYRLSDADRRRHAAGERASDELEEDPNEQRALERARELRREGRGYKAIAKALTDEGYAPRGARWWPMTVKRMVSKHQVEKQR